MIDPKQGMLMDRGLITIRTFAYRHEAELAKSALEASGIAAVVFADDGGRQEANLQFAQGTKLMVKAEDAEQARAVLDSR